MARRHGPRILPLILLALLAALLIPGGGWLLFAFFKIVLVFWLVTSLVAVLGIGRSYRRMRRSAQSGYLPHWRNRARGGQVPCGRRSEQHMTY
jgi:membrane protein implicated in regulation of membrane protease activity